MKKMNKEVQKIYDAAIEKSYYFEDKNAYWTGYFIGKVEMAVTDEDMDLYLKKVQIASEKLYENIVLVCKEFNVGLEVAE